MELSQKVKDLAKKLLALVNNEATAKGEKESAEAALKRHLDKYGMTIEDVDGSDLIEMDILIVEPDPLDENKFMLQIVATVIGIPRTDAMPKFRDTDSGEIFYKPEVTAAEAIEIKAKIEFYWKDFQVQIKAFRMAYFAKNNLLLDAPADSEEVSMSAETSARIRRMMAGVDARPFYKQLK